MRELSSATAVAAMFLLGSPVLARAETHAHQPAKYCGHRDDWRLTDEKLRIVLARHAGWRFMLIPGVWEHDEYLERTPSWDWKREAHLHPERALLCYAKLGRVNLSSVNLHGADLSDADLSRANLNHARLARADLRNADMSGANLRGADLSSADLTRAYLAGADLRRALLIGANLRGAWMFNSKLGDADLSRAEATGANMPSADLNHADLIHTILNGADLDRANVVGANLSSAELVNAKLNRAELSGADLRGANLAWANLSSANLSHAALNGAHLRGADLSGARLIGAKMSRADLREAVLTGADLGGANLSYANLSRARMLGTTLAKARLANADVTDAAYAPQGEPPENYVVGIKGLPTVTIPLGDDIGLIQLRKLLQEAGLRDDERAVTYVIERSTTSQRLASGRAPDALEGIFRLIAFDWTTAYGLYPGRALILILLVGTIFTTIYLVAIWGWTSRQLDESSGIFQVFPADAIDTTRHKPALYTEARVTKIIQPDFGNALRSAVYFSILSAFNIGFEAFNVGDWIRRVQAREYALQSTGWVRVVSGVQSLLSLYLLAIWVLTYFGRPFQ
jgi:uncharacterized protein YjbI with pentapeptide repeats